MADALPLDALLRAADLPAREALELARGSPWRTAARALAGLGAIGLASSLARMLGTGAPAGAALGRIDAVVAMFEAIAMVLPGVVVFSAYARLEVPPRVIAAAASLGLLVGGAVALAMLPLVAFLALTAGVPGGALPPLDLLVAPAALGAVASIPVRVIAALDRRPIATFVARLYALLLFGAFAIRCLSQLRS